MALSQAVTLYVLRNMETGLRYVGITNHLARRLKEHREGLSKGSHHLDGSFSLLLTETYPSYAEARQREKFLKSGQGRAWLDTRFPAQH